MIRSRVAQPSLNLIRGFVAVGRRMSITLAAQDLHLTQSAVSRQLQTLEEAIGVKLLIRGHRSIVFTPEGHQLFQVADLAIQHLHEAVSGLMHPQERLPVTITASIGVTSLWLLPRLGGFQQLYPHIDLRIAANNKVLDLKAGDADLAIRYGARPQAVVPVILEPLFDEPIVPVAHSSLGLKYLDADAVSKHVLLEFEDPRLIWLQWADQLSALGLGHVASRRFLRFNHYDQVIQAALAGQGIALGRLALIAPLLADRHLVTLQTACKGGANTHSYWLIQAEISPRQDVVDVISWVQKEALDLRALLRKQAATGQIG